MALKSLSTPAEGKSNTKVVFFIDYICVKNSFLSHDLYPNIRLAFNTRVSKLQTTLNMLYRTRNSKQFWKVVGNTRKDQNDWSKDISIDVLEQHFELKFSQSKRVATDEIVQAQDSIDAKLMQQSKNTEQVTSNRVRQLIRQLKLNASPAQDENTAEHLIYALDSQIIDHLSYMLTLCIQFGVVPENFRRGVLIPIPKKSGCDTTQAKNWETNYSLFNIF